MEDVGEEELIDRSLVQVWRRDFTGTKVKTCRIHDLFRDLCMEKAEEENFLKFIQKSENSLDVTLVASMPRRIAIYPGERGFYLKGKHPKLRSLLLMNQEKVLINVHISNFNNFKLLRVLKLTRWVEEWHVSSEIGNLHHLMYLRLRCIMKIILPRAIGKLKNLHTLYLRCLFHFVVPNVVFQLERLRQFVTKGDEYPEIERYFHWSRNFSSKNIETLKYMWVDKKLIENNEVLRLTHIQCFGIIFKKSKDVKPILLLAILDCLKSLSMTLCKIFYRNQAHLHI
ncbi:hypothetical protein ES332_A10G271200v1 [Gossypium tomentosum]|uniref:Disease resistance R13L4/SHOC-2-like LRR domain-containing protein n=1 Tax=Gossypium tomentosum TaxID=34277 RepID=A0A5D2NXA4_GOSTO|nr:hypothetical protein ES332_A10G271200v1 [Gossypium tomentosum]